MFIWIMPVSTLSIPDETTFPQTDRQAQGQNQKKDKHKGLEMSKTQTQKPTDVKLDRGQGGSNLTIYNC